MQGQTAYRPQLVLRLPLLLQPKRPPGLLTCPTYTASFCRAWRATKCRKTKLHRYAWSCWAGTNTRTLTHGSTHTHVHTSLWKTQKNEIPCLEAWDVIKTQDLLKNLAVQRLQAKFHLKIIHRTCYQSNCPPNSHLTCRNIFPISAINDDTAQPLAAPRVHPHPPRLTLHLLEFAHVRAEQRVDALSLSVPVDVQLDVCWEAAAQTPRERAERRRGQLWRWLFKGH